MVTFSFLDLVSYPPRYAAKRVMLARHFSETSEVAQRKLQSVWDAGVRRTYRTVQGGLPLVSGSARV